MTDVRGAGGAWWWWWGYGVTSEPFELYNY